jgi:SAM-dependent methyltransferase
VTDLPIPPLEFRRLVGPIDPALFDNPSRRPVFPGQPVEVYRSVLDFGCGCGRVARQLIQQDPRPQRYLGFDRHRGMIAWCQEHLAPHAPGFEFQHHDVDHPLWNPGGAPGHLSFPAPDGDVTLFIAWSVFTHLLEADAVFYLRELARVLAPDGVAMTTWFLFDKSGFPMMQEFQNAIFINATDPTNAVIFDRDWLLAELERCGLVVQRAQAPAIRGFQWTLYLAPKTGDRVSVALPEDTAPIGIARPPIG